jgi:hypothetical protein
MHGTPWTKAPEGQESRIWLRDDLPETFPDARIMIYEYDSDMFGRRSSNFVDEANSLLLRIHAKRLTLVRHTIMNSDDEEPHSANCIPTAWTRA